MKAAEVKSISTLIAHYQRQINQEDLAEAYHFLLQVTMKIRSTFLKYYGDRFEVGNISPGYLDYSYFPFFDAALRQKKLRFGIVLNHAQMRFELWLMGQNSTVQQDYWQKLKDTKWNMHLQSMPRYSVLETVLVTEPDFSDVESLVLKINSEAIRAVEAIVKFI